MSEGFEGKELSEELRRLLVKELGLNIDPNDLGVAALKRESGKESLVGIGVPADADPRVLEKLKKIFGNPAFISGSGTGPGSDFGEKAGAVLKELALGDREKARKMFNELRRPKEQESKAMHAMIMGLYKMVRHDKGAADAFTDSVMNTLNLNKGPQIYGTDYVTDIAARFDGVADEFNNLLEETLAKVNDRVGDFVGRVTTYMKEDERKAFNLEKKSYDGLLVGLKDEAQMFKDDFDALKRLLLMLDMALMMTSMNDDPKIFKKPK